jgi:hypothetical protein
VTTAAIIAGAIWATLCLLIPAWIFTIVALDRIARLTAPRRQQRRDVETVRGLGARLGADLGKSGVTRAALDELADLIAWDLQVDPPVGGKP